MRAASHPARPLQGRRGVSTPVRTPPAPARQRTLDASPRCRDCRNLRVAASGDRLRWPALGSMLEGLSCAIAAHPGLGQRRSPIPARPGTPAVPAYFPPEHPPPRTPRSPHSPRTPPPPPPPPTPPPPCNPGPDAAASQNPGDIDLESLLGDSDAHLVYEGLYRLRELKVEALRIVRAEGVRPNGRDFEPWDFGIPQIDRLLARFGADPVEGQ